MRYASIDILRTVAIFVMVFVHFGENLSGYTVPVAGLGAPLFAFLSGVSYRLWSSAQEKRGKSETEITKISVRRGLFVLGVGFAFNVFVWMPEDTYNWDVLTFIGVALLLLNFARRIPLSISILISVMALLISPVLRSMADYNAYWVNGYFEADLTMSDLWIGFLAVGYFPVLPWIAYSLAGFVTASLLFSDEPDAPPARLGAVWAGAALIGSAAIALIARHYLTSHAATIMLGGWHMFPPTIEYVLGTAGMALLLLGVLHRLVDQNPAAKRFEGSLNIAKTFSRYSLTIYVLHHIVHLWPLWIYGVVNGQEPTYYWRIAMPLSVSLPLAGLFMACCYFLFRWLGPDDRRGIESAMRWLCD